MLVIQCKQQHEWKSVSSERTSVSSSSTRVWSGASSDITELSLDESCSWQHQDSNIQLHINRDNISTLFITLCSGKKHPLTFSSISL